MKVNISHFASFTLLVIAVFFFISSCKDDPTEPEVKLEGDEKLVGTWELITIKATVLGQPIELTPLQAGLESTITFNSDLTFNAVSTDSDGTTNDEGTWSTKDGNLTLNFKDDEPETTPYTFQENGDVSIVQLMEISGSEVLTTLIFTKKS